MSDVAAFIIDQVLDRQTVEMLDLDLKVEEHTDFYQKDMAARMTDATVRHSVLRQLALREGVL